MSEMKGYGEPTMSAPSTRRDNVVDILNGQRILDPYRWLEAMDSPDVRVWIDQQNAHTRAVLDPLPHRDELRRRLEMLFSTGAFWPPTVRGGRLFYERRNELQDQPVLCLRRDPEGEEEVLIDPNGLSEEGLVSLDWWYPSMDGRLLAYGLSSQGSEQSTLYVLDVDSGEDLTDKIPQTRHCRLAWLPDATGFYYTRLPVPGNVPQGEEHYHERVRLHRLGADPAHDLVVFGEGRDMHDSYSINLSPDGRYLVVVVFKGYSETEVYLRDLERSEEFTTIFDGAEAIAVGEVMGSNLYLLTNHQAPNYKLYKIDLEDTRRESWREIVPEGDAVMDWARVVGGRLFLHYLRNAYSHLEIHDLDGNLLHSVEFPTLGTISGVGGEWDGAEAYIGFESFFLPPTIFRLDIQSGNVEIYDQLKMPVDTSPYEATQVWYESKDGTKVSMFIVSKKNLTLDGKNPTILNGYGGFNVSMTPYFSKARLIWLEAGGVLAIANLRGGAEYGEAWHRAGMLGNKQNVFDDFIAAAEWLIDGGYTEPSRLALEGGSNGGLLVAAAMVQRPELFRAVVCEVPVLDMLRYQHFSLAQYWISEYGDPEKPEHFFFLRAYSPYHNVVDGTPYPAVLFTAGESDTRVDPMHAKKMTARLQAASSSGLPIVLRYETKSGHGYGTPLSKRIDEIVDTFSFLFWQLGMEL